MNIPANEASPTVTVRKKPGTFALRAQPSDSSRR